MNEQQQQKPNDQCLDMGYLVSLRDGELTDGERAKARAHLATCPDCAADERSVAISSREVYDLLAALDPLTDEIPDTTTALAAIQARLDTESEHKRGPETMQALRPSRTRLFQGNRRRRYGWLTAAVAAVLVALLLLPNAGALADQFLALFRVQQFQPVSINPQSFSTDLTSYLQNFGDMQGHYNSPPDISDPTQAQVKQYINFPLLLPSHLPPGVGHVVHFYLLGSYQGTVTFNTAKARAYLDQTGQSDVRIPASLNGATFFITSDPGVVVNYSNCQQRQRLSVNKGISSQAESTSAQCNSGTPFYMVEVPGPTVQGEGKASLKVLREFMLSLPKLAPEIRDMLQHLDLDKGTVPLPIPPEVHAQQVTVQDTSGVLLADSSLKIGAVIWQTHGIIYMIATETSNGTEVLDTANSLR